MSQAKDLFNAGRYAEALPLLNPADPIELLGIGACLEYTGRYEEARQVFFDAYDRTPDGAHAVQVLACLYRAGDKDRLDYLAPKLLADHDHDSVRYCVGEHLLKSGLFEEGFALFDSRKSHMTSTKKFNAMSCPEWQGEDCGLLCITAEQGIGDVVQQLAALHHLGGRSVMLWVEPRLKDIVQRSFPWIRVTDDKREILFASCSSTSRKAMLGDIQSRYIKSPLDWTRFSWITNARQPAGDLTIGLAWDSTRTSDKVRKGVDLELLAPIIDSGHKIVNLQHGPVGRTPRIPQRGLVPENLEALVWAITGCHAVVTTSNSVAHFAAALGVRTHLILPDDRTVYWYWQYSGDCPIYPAMTTHRLHRGATIQGILEVIRHGT